MGERHTAMVRNTGRRIGSVLLSAGLIISCETPVTVEVPKPSIEHTYDAEGFQKKPEIALMLLQSKLATVIRDPETGLPFMVSDHLPPDKDRGLQEGLNEPVVRLSLAKNASHAIYVSQSSDENGFFIFYDSSVSLLVNAAIPESTDILGNPAMLPYALDHESTHALNAMWWEMLANYRFSDDIILRKKIIRVAQTCDAVNRDVLKTFVEATRDRLADTFEAASGPNVPDGVGTVLFKPHDYTAYHNAMQAAASAIRQNDETIYDAPHLRDKACHTPELLSIPEMIAHHWLEIPNDLTFNRVEDFLQAQQDVGAAAMHAFVCLREGPGLSELLKDIRPLKAGHPADNPTEAASSLITSLLSNPDHLERCLSDMHSLERQRIENYISALIDLMNYTNPEIIKILKENPKAAQIIDRLWQPAA